MTFLMSQATINFSRGDHFGDLWKYDYNSKVSLKEIGFDFTDSG